MGFRRNTGRAHGENAGEQNGDSSLGSAQPDPSQPDHGLPPQSSRPASGPAPTDPALGGCQRTKPDRIELRHVQPDQAESADPTPHHQPAMSSPAPATAAEEAALRGGEASKVKNPVATTRGATAHTARRFPNPGGSLRDCSLSLERNAIHAVIGGRGAGKTELLRLLAGVQRPERGSVAVFGADPYDNQAIMDQIVFAGESVPYPENWTVGDVLGVAARRYPNWDASYAEMVANAFGLDSRRRLKKCEPDGRTLLSLVVGLAARAPLTLLDEPVRGVHGPDLSLALETLAAAVTVHPRTVVISAESLAGISGFMDRLVLLYDGAPRADLTLHDAQQRLTVLSGSQLDVLNAVETLRLGGISPLRTDRKGAAMRVVYDVPHGVPTLRQRLEESGLRLVGGALSLEYAELEELVEAFAGAAGETPEEAPGEGEGGGRAAEGNEDGSNR